MDEGSGNMGEETNNRYDLFFRGGGEMGMLTGNYNWSATSLGTPDQWPSCLLTTLGIILHSRFPMFLFWGPDHICFYNDAYRSSLGNNGKHPYALGKKGEEIWPEIWPDIKPLIDQVLSGGEATWSEDQLLPIYRNERMEDVYWTYSYSPVIGESGKAAGVFVTCSETTKKVAALNMLQISEQRFQNLIREATIGIIVLSGENMVVEIVNEAYNRLIGKTYKDLLGKPLFDVIPETKPYFHPHIEHVRITGQSQFLYDHPYFINGVQNEGHLNIIFQPYKEKDGRISGVILLCQDVTGQVTDRKKVKESEQRIRNTIIQSPVAMCLLRGTEYIVEIANARMLELWGKNMDDVIQKPIFEGLPEARGQGFEELLQKVFITGETYRANEQPVMLPRNGKTETVYVNFVYDAIKEIDGTISGIIAVANEVTEQVLARRKIQEAEEKTRLVINSAELGIYEVFYDTDTLIADSRFNKIWGFSETRSRNEYASIIHPEDLPARARAHQESLETGQLQYEARIIRHDGSVRWIRVQGKLLFDTMGTPVKLLGVVQDITEQKQFAKALENKVKERTKALAAANQQLKQSNIELNEFVYIASHDLQEPLRKIRTFTGLMDLSIRTNPGETKSYISKIYSSSERMQALINDVIEFSLLSRDQEKFQETDLNSILQHVLEDNNSLIHEKGAKITCGVLPVIEAIPFQMSQLFTNLLSNALKFYSEKRPIEISIHSRILSKEEVSQWQELNEEHVYHLITFRDNGIGFHQKYAKQIFSMFKRLHGKLEYTGTGIGLAMCKKIAFNHNGIIYAESAPGEGTSFIFILPEVQDKTDLLAVINAED